MTALSNLNGKRQSPPLSTIISTGFLVGTLDLCSALLYSYIKRGAGLQTILHYVSKTAFGKNALSDPAFLNMTGLLVHFAIAMAWTLLFFVLYRLITLMRQNRIATGIVYGLFIWTIMYIVVLPAWNKRPFVFNALSSSINVIILVVAIGLPLSFIAHRHYSKK